MTARVLSRFPQGSKVQWQLAMLLASAVLAIYACEAFLFWDPLELRGPRAKEGFDMREPLDVVRDLRATGVAAYPVAAATSWSDAPPRVNGTAVVPLSGVPFATTVMCNESGSYVIYRSDRFGFNAPDSQWNTRPQVALVGDSFVEGWCVSREDSFGGLIRRAIPATLNVGYTGHGPLAELGTIREYVGPRHPVHVFWFFYEGNDLRIDLPREMKSDVLHGYLKAGFGQELERHSAVVGDQMRRVFDSRFALLQPPPQSSPLIGILKLRSSRALVNRARVRPPPTSKPTDRLDDLRRILAEAKRSVEAWGGILHFVYLPDLPLIVGDTSPDDHNRVVALATDLGLQVLDLFPDFKNHPAPLSLFPYEDGRHLVKTRGLHYNPAGHRLVAQRVLGIIEPRQRPNH